ncbi:MAG: phage tail tape measure protein, partial [Gammaproteobacteria bacterium]|nr:phage tail tape measure protein [Gammaproteobacteria bacterium]
MTGTNVGTLTAHLTLDQSGLASGLATSKAQIGAFGGRLAGGLKGATRAVFGLQGALAGLGASAGAGVVLMNISKSGAQFQLTMETVGGVTRATTAEFAALTNVAREMGEKTEWTANQAAEGLKFFGMAGFSAANAVKALPGALDLATAGQIDLGRSADIATNALTAMRLPVEELGRVNDVFIGTTTRSNTNIEMMAESFKYAAPLGAALGYDIEELSSHIGQLGNAGIQGSMAGTQLAMAYTKAGEIADKFGFKSSKLLDVLDDLRRQGVSNQEMFELFGIRAGRAALVLSTVTDQTREFEGVLRTTNGESKALADRMRDTVSGAFKELKSVIESVGLDAFDTYKTKLKDTIRAATQWIREHRQQIVTFLANMANTMIAVIKVVGRVAGAIWQIMVNLGLFSTHVGYDIDTLGTKLNNLQPKLDAIERWSPLRIIGEHIRLVGEDIFRITEELGNTLALLVAEIMRTIWGGVNDIFLRAKQLGMLLKSLWALTDVRVSVGRGGLDVQTPGKDAVRRAEMWLKAL